MYELDLFIARFLLLSTEKSSCISFSLLSQKRLHSHQAISAGFPAALLSCANVTRGILTGQGVKLLSRICSADSTSELKFRPSHSTGVYSAQVSLCGRGRVQSSPLSLDRHLCTTFSPRCPPDWSLSLTIAEPPHPCCPQLCLQHEFAHFSKRSADAQEQLGGRLERCP